MKLFQPGDFTLHSGDSTWWRIDCDVLSDTSLGVLARRIIELVGPFEAVGCPESHFGLMEFAPSRGEVGMIAELWRAVGPISMGRGYPYGV